MYNSKAVKIDESIVQQLPVVSDSTPEIKPQTTSPSIRIAQLEEAMRTCTSTARLAILNKEYREEQNRLNN